MKLTFTKRILSATLALALLGVMLAAPAAFATSSIYRTIYYGDSGNDVIKIQKKLKSMGYLKKVTGDYLDSTQRAVRHFERDMGYTRTDYCTQKMQKHIINAAKKEGPFRTLHYGDNGDDVKAIQKKLRALGLFDGTIGGNYLKKTRAAVKEFEMLYGYKVTSYCSVHMQKLILAF